MEAKKEAKELYHTEQLFATFLAKAPKSWTRLVSTSNRFNALSTLHDDASFLEMGNDKGLASGCSNKSGRRRKEEEILVSVGKEQQSETKFINKASDVRAQCRAEILAAKASRYVHSASSKHILAQCTWTQRQDGQKQDNHHVTHQFGETQWYEDRRGKNSAFKRMVN